MMHWKSPSLKIAVRPSALSRAQLKEVKDLLLEIDPSLSIDEHFVETAGDRDKITSLRHAPDDFFTQDLDAYILSCHADCAVHSLKDLPPRLHPLLELAAITKGKSSRDLLLFKGTQLLSRGYIATSSPRREENVKSVLPHAIFFDLRGTIEERLQFLEKEDIDGIVMAEAALQRLRLDLPHFVLPGETAKGQGKLALVIRKGESNLKNLLQCLHYTSV